MEKDRVRQHFETIAGDYDRWKERSSYYHELLAGAYREFEPAGTDVLEFGCRTGNVLTPMREE